MLAYDHKKIEKKWQKIWAAKKVYKTSDTPSSKGKFYVLDMFPYPSGEGLHVGHPKGYIATDVISRMKRMQGSSVLHPMGFDAFGLPAENFALKNKIHPEESVKKNILRYKKQLEILGLDYDWSREISTTDPSYYKWTQWIFLELYKKGLAYRSDEPINWCPSCKTGLANEDVESGKCERCGTPVEKKKIRQWVLKITDYAEILLKDMEKLDWPEHIKELQRNWIGKSEGVLIKFEIQNQKPETNTESETENFKLEDVEVFTTRADTIFGATYLVLAPEHPLIKKIKKQISNWDEVVRYIVLSEKKTEIERTAEKKEKTGVKLMGVEAVNPANHEAIPIFIADYVLPDYGTGAIMAVPAHDERDREFADICRLPIKEINLADTDEIVSKYGRPATKYKLRDWVFSRQRYWGEPIPIIHCDKCGTVPVPEKDLPVKLPKVKFYEPTGTGESPLAAITKWVNVKCPRCGGNGKRETNTMPQWAGSSWYYLRYIDPGSKKSFVDQAKEKQWMPVDLYVGGAEHATRHLIYARFWHKVLFDLGYISTNEPFMSLRPVGLIMGSDGRKMSKRFGNIVNPDEVVEQFGADTLRVYEMFMGPFADSISWSTDNVLGPRRFLERVWRLQGKISPQKTNDDHLLKFLNDTIKKVGEDIMVMKFNTAISQLMMLSHELEKRDTFSKEIYEKFILLLSPFAPHITEELWGMIGNKGLLVAGRWPVCDPIHISPAVQIIAIQINGKVRSEIPVSEGEIEGDVKGKVLADPKVNKWLDGKEIKKIIYVAGKIISIVTDR